MGNGHMILSVLVAPAQCLMRHDVSRDITVSGTCHDCRAVSTHILTERLPWIQQRAVAVFAGYRSRGHEGYSGGDARHVANFRLAARLRERRPASRKEWVTTLSPAETGRACIIQLDSPKTRSSTCAH